MKFVLGLIHFFHLLVDIFNSIYIFIFPPIYDIYFSLWMFLVTLHWALLKRECILSYIEKKLINPKYKLGDDPYNLPYQDIYYNKYTLSIKWLSLFIALCVIIYRNIENALITSMCILALLLSYVFLNKP
jgi:hypothetical protein